MSQKLNVENRIVAYVEFGKGLPIVLIHGFPCDHRAWLDVANLLAKKCRVVLIDLPGFGGSDLLPGPGTMAAFANTIDVVMQELGIDSAFIAGHSMGGYVALELARLHPERVKGLALVGSQIFADTDEARARRAQQVSDLTAHGISVVLGMAQKLTANGIRSAELAEWISDQDPTAAAFALQAMSSRKDQSDLFRNLNKPCLLIHGELDDLVLPSKAESAANINLSAKMMLLPGVGHSPMIESPNETFTAIWEWMQIK